MSAYAAVPYLLKDTPNWVVWKYETRDGKETKVPYDAKANGDSVHAKVNDSATWATFDRAAEVADILSGHDYNGVGFCLHGTRYVGFDFDGVVVDGKPEPFVLDILQKLGNPYSEITPSGNGLRAFVEYPVPLPAGKRKFSRNTAEKYGAEIYSGSEGGRYLTISGAHFSGNGIPKVLDISLAYFMVSQILNEKLKKLWVGDLSDYDGDQSSADLALLNILARRFENNPQKMEWAFNASKLGQRDKWTQRQDYRDRTIAKAISGEETQNKSAEAPQVASVSSPAPNAGDYTKTGEKRKPETPQGIHPLLAEAGEAVRQFDKGCLVFDPAATLEPRIPILEGFVLEGDSALWVGAKKTEKSLFAMRIGMHIACGKSWCGYRCRRAYKVCYLDAENGEHEISERYNTLLREFSDEEQVLIRANFKIIDGRKWQDAGGSLDYLNDNFWDWYAGVSVDAEVHFLDCLYMFHSKEPRDSIGMLEVMQVLRLRLQNASNTRASILLNHTRSLSNDDLKKVGSLSLEKLGASNFSEQSFGSKVLLKYVTAITCFDKQSKRDEDGEIISQEIHIQFCRRSGAESPILKFEPIDDGIARRLIRTLSKGAKSAAVDLRMACGDSGSWASMHEAAKYLKCARSNSYRHLTELRVKDYLTEDEQGRLHLQVSLELAHEISIEEQKAEAYHSAREWLRAYLVRPTEAENVLIAGDEQGHNREDLIKARHELKLVEEPRMVGEAMTETIFWRPKKKPGNRKNVASEIANRRWSQKEPEAVPGEDSPISGHFTFK